MPINIADSDIKSNVKSAGGKVDGVLRFSIQWNDVGDCKDDLDAHCIEPSKNLIYYSSKDNYETTGNLDVDITSPGTKVAVENITWSNKSKMRKALESGTTGLFDTHPCFASRVRNAAQENTTGIFQTDVPASSLILHFEPLCRNVTWDLYRDLFGVHINPADMKPMSELLHC